jgi:hypothetical protein
MRQAAGSFCFFVNRMLAAKPAIFGKFQLVRRRALVFSRRIVTALAFGTGKRDEDSHRYSPLSIIR